MSLNRQTPHFLRPETNRQTDGQTDIQTPRLLLSPIH
jgi:hypothetical protein